MGGSERMDLDGSTARAWRDFRSALGDAVASLGGGSLRVEAEWSATGPGTAPYLRFGCDHETGQVYAEVRAEPDPAGRARLDPSVGARLEGLGWQRPTSDGRHRHWWVVSDRGHADQLAELAVQALREVLGVLHPAFLRALPTARSPHPRQRGPRPGPVTARPHAVSGDPPDLQRLVDQALTPVLGHVPKRDENGDIPIIVGQSVVFLRSLPTLPAIRLHVDLALGVTEPGRAEFEVQVLNRDHRFARFWLEGDAVRAVLDVPARPLAPEHLREAVRLMCAMTERVAEDLAVRVGGRRLLGEREGPVTAAAVSLGARLRALDQDRPGGVRPRQVASLCGDDPAVLLGLLRWARERELAAADERDHALVGGRGDELAPLTEVADDARRVRKVVSRALRMVVERDER